MNDLDHHPCFNPKVRASCGRVHLPVAPACNVQCNFCNRDCDCVNESRPGVTSGILSPHQALAYLEKIVEKDPKINVVGIAGPGDPFANARETMETLRLVRAKYPDILLCVATNGVDLLPHIEELAQLRVGHVTVTVNAVSPAIGERVYAWARDGKRVLRGTPAAGFILGRQMAALARLKAEGITVKVNTIFLPGINDTHVEKIAEEIGSLGVDFMNVVPLYGVKDTPFADLPAPDRGQLAAVRAACAQYVPQLEHCTRCRADAVGLLGQAQEEGNLELLRACAELPLRPNDERPYVAVGSMEGVLVNQHMGEASHLWIFGREQESFAVVDTRETPEAGSGDARWLALAETLKDCRAVVVSGVGQKPRRILTENGIRVVEAEGVIERVLETIYQGGEIRFAPRPRRCGVDCMGNGQGCS